MQMNLIAAKGDVIQYTSTVATMSTQTVYIFPTSNTQLALLVGNSIEREKNLLLTFYGHWAKQSNTAHSHSSYISHHSIWHLLSMWLYGHTDESFTLSLTELNSFNYVIYANLYMFSILAFRVLALIICTRHFKEEEEEKKLSTFPTFYYSKCI